MANYQNTMRCSRRPVQSMPAQSSPDCCCQKMDGCPDTHDHFPADMPIAMAYVPWQKWQEIYEPCRALESWTIFKELDKPFLCKGGMRR